jgi:hypothetical protein
MQLAYTLHNNPSVVKHRRDHAALKECSSEKRDPSEGPPGLNLYVWYLELLINCNI